MEREFRVGHNIGAIVHFNTEIKSALNAAKSFETVYPKGQLILQSSNSISVERVKEVFKYEIVECFPYVSDLIKIQKKNFKFSLSERVKCLENHLINVKTALNKIDTKYVIWLHPDHKIIKNIPENKLDLDLEYTIRNKYSKNTLYDFEKVTSFSSNLKGYGIPSYHKRESFLSVINYLLQSESEILYQLISISNDFICDDVLVPLAHEMLGFKIGDRKLTRELRRRFGKFTTPFPSILHQIDIPDKL